MSAHCSPARRYRCCSCGVDMAISRRDTSNRSDRVVDTTDPCAACQDALFGFTADRYMGQWPWPPPFLRYGPLTRLEERRVGPDYWKDSCIPFADHLREREV